MTSPVIAVSADASLDEVLQIMVARSVKRLPVLNTGRICGIVSRPDVLRAVSQARVRHDHAHAPLEARDSGASLAAGESGEEVISASAFRDAAETLAEQGLEGAVEKTDPARLIGAKGLVVQMGVADEDLPGKVHRGAPGSGGRAMPGGRKPFSRLISASGCQSPMPI